MIGIVDVDLIDRKTSFPNLACLKISGYHKSRGENTVLVTTMEQAMDCDSLSISKVFTESSEPGWINLIDIPKSRGGTGYDLQNAAPLPYEIEHAFPDYALYEEFAKTSPYIHGTGRDAYLKASIGFTTRGCFRRCPFCVNRNKTRVEEASRVSEFYDPTRPYVFLLDDNILGYPKWADVFAQLEETGKKISYRQGMDIRLMTHDKAKTLQRIRYWKDIIFAFDNIAESESFVRGADIYREHCDKETMVYCLIGFYKRGLDEIRDFVTRTNVCKRYGFFPYVMRHKDGEHDKYKDIYTQAARFHNQRSFCRHGSLLEYIRRYGNKTSRALLDNDDELRRELNKLE